MTKGPKGFSGAEKDELKTKLCLECEHSWALHGYKKTSVRDLTANIGISTGAFYLLYSSKEELFCETLKQVQDRLINRIWEIVDEKSGKAGFVKAMIWLFQEYEKSPFLYNSDTPDFLAFLNRLHKDRIEKLKFDSVTFFYDIIERAHLILKVDKEKAYAVINTLLYTVTIKDGFTNDHLEIFEILLNSIIDELFE